MSIDHGKVLALSPEAIEAGWRATFSTDNPFCPCDLKTFAKAARWAERALAQPAEPDDIAESAKKIVSELPRYFHEVRGSYVHWGVFPAKHKDGEWVKWSDVESGAFIEALIRLQSTPTAKTAQPAEAVEGDETDPTALQIEYARGYGDGVKHGEQLRPTAAVSPEELRLYVSEQEACELERSHDAAQGAVAWYVFADTEKWVTLDRSEADDNRAEGCQVRPLIFGDIHPQAAPAQWDDTRRLDWLDTQRQDDVGQERNGDPYLIARVWTVYEQKETIREAIDEAMTRAAAPSQEGES